MVATHRCLAGTKSRQLLVSCSGHPLSPSRDAHFYKLKGTFWTRNGEKASSATCSNLHLRLHRMSPPVYAWQLFQTHDSYHISISTYDISAEIIYHNSNICTILCPLQIPLCFQVLIRFSPVKVAIIPSQPLAVVSAGLQEAIPGPEQPWSHELEIDPLGSNSLRNDKRSTMCEKLKSPT